MLKQLLLLVFFILSYGAAAQTNFRPGYVLTPAGDTLRGEVDARGAQRNARLARFRSAPEAAVVEYQPRQLRGYGLVGDRLYQTETVMLADSLKRSVQPYSPPDTLARHSFLEVVVRGELSLLYLRDERGNDHYYVQLPGQPTQELVQIISYATPTTNNTTGGVTIRRKSDDYRRTLAAATQRCPSVQLAITKVDLNLNGLTRIVRQYNECVGSVSATPAAASRRNHVWLSVMAGAETSRLVIRNTDKSRLAVGNSKVMPVGGVALNLQLAGVNKNILVRLEALYEQQSFLNNQVFGQKPSQSSTSIKTGIRSQLSTIRVPLLVGYNYPVGRLRPFGYLGYSFSLFLKNDTETRDLYLLGGTQYNGVWRPWSEEKSELERGMLAGFGLKTARLNQRNASLELRYERSDAFSNVESISTINRFYLLLSYDLTK